MNFQEIWTVVEPYVIKAVELAVAVATMIGGSLAVFRRADKSIGLKLNEKRISASVAENLIGSTLNIDLTALTEKRLKKIEDNLADILDNRLKGIEKSIHSNTVATCGTAELLVRAREITKEGREALLCEIQEAKGLSQTAQEPQKEIITLKLETSASALEKGTKENDKNNISFV